MTDTINHRERSSLGWLRWAGWGGAAALLLAPAVAMQVAPNSGALWTASDFMLAGLMLGIVGLAIELTVRASASWTMRGAAVLAIATSFLLTWANLAVGYVGPEDNPYNAVFFGVVVLALLGSAFARFGARGMAWAMLAAGIAHGIAGAIGYAEDPVTGKITIVFVVMWLTSAALFKKAASER